MEALKTRRQEVLKEVKEKLTTNIQNLAEKTEYTTDDDAMAFFIAARYQEIGGWKEKVTQQGNKITWLHPYE